MPSPYPVITSRRDLVAALKAADWVISRAARALRVSRETLYRSMRRYAVKREQPSPEFFRERARIAGSTPWKKRKRAA